MQAQRTAKPLMGSPGPMEEQGVCEMNEAITREVNDRLRVARLSAGLTQKEVAKECAVSRQAVSAWERGSSAPTSTELRKLGLLYAVSIDYVLYGIRMMPISDKKMLSEVFRNHGNVEPSESMY